MTTRTTGAASTTAFRATRYAAATEIVAGDVLLTDEGVELVVAFAVVECDRAHLSLVGGEDVTLTSDDVVEIVEVAS